MHAMRLFGEQWISLVAGVFDDGRSAGRAALAVSYALRDPRNAVEIVTPGDPAFALKLEPESPGIWRTLVRAHCKLGVVGLVLGTTFAVALLAAGWPAAVSSPGFTLMFASIFGMFGGLMLGGLVTLRPDHGRVISKVRDASTTGLWSVVAHPINRSAAEVAGETLKRAGGQVVRSL
jgi:hypothetical protein